jgi:hypothetical protein
MPTAAKHACPGGCGRLVSRGKCPFCVRRSEQARGTAHQRGYTYEWVLFRGYFLGLLQEAGILPICGAVLPDGPNTQDSSCQQLGLQTWTHLHFDHEPPLQEHERSDMRKVCDPTRIQLLCNVDHNRKTQRQQRDDCYPFLIGGYRNVQ